VVLFLFGAFIVRLIAAVVSPGHETDMNCFRGWSELVSDGGFSAFYRSEHFTDYPPGYMYILYVLGWIKKLFLFPDSLFSVILRLPAMLCDIFCAWLIYKIGKKSATASALSVFYALNPAVILNSAIWGQVDSVLALVLLLCVVVLSEKRTIPAYFLFAVAILLKPQALILAPLVLFAFYQKIISVPCRKTIIKELSGGILAIGFMFLFMLPFGLEAVLTQYKNTLDSYAYMSVNAFNLWAAFGLNWQELTPVASLFGNIFIVGITIASFAILKYYPKKSSYFLTSGFLYFSTYLFSVKMHERYAFGAMLFLACAYLFSGKKRHKYLYFLISASQIFNTAYVLIYYQQDPNQYYRTPLVTIASVLNILLMFYFIYVLLFPVCYRKKKEITVQKTRKRVPFQRVDWIFLVLITTTYSIVAFANLGDRSAPETDVILKPGNEIILELEQEETVDNLMVFIGNYPVEETTPLHLSLYNQQNQMLEEKRIEDASVFHWASIDVGQNIKKIRLWIENGKLSIKEIGIFSNHTLLTFSTNQPSVSDEQPLVPESASYKNGTYFDEIYHPRTAYEFIHHLPVYEWTHPPLGKFLISLGIRTFGMNPFGWRFAGVLFGIFMIPLFYLFCKQLLEKTWLCVPATIWFTFDFMHYAQTRLATIDGFVTFFILGMFYFMYRYCMQSFYDTPIQKTYRSLIACGIFTGLSIACKWQGAYAAVGIAVIFFYLLWIRYQEALQQPEYHFWKKTVKTCAGCIVFFVLIPALIYAVSYIPYLQANGEDFWGILRNQRDMFVYHSDTVVASEHPYASRWYSWPMMLRPIWYYSKSFADGFAAGISAFGNPAVWWLGIPATVYCVYLALRKKDFRARFLLIAYAANFLPWTAISRTTFIYHYFPSVPFVVLMIAYSFKQLSFPKKKLILFVYTGIVIGLFVLFYPVLTGIPVKESFVIHFLRWLPGWVLI